LIAGKDLTTEEADGMFELDVGTWLAEHREDLEIAKAFVNTSDVQQADVR